MSTTGILLYGFYLGTEYDVQTCNSDIITEWENCSWILKDWYSKKFNKPKTDCPVQIVESGVYEFPGYYLTLENSKDTLFYGEDYNPKYLDYSIFTNFLALAEATVKLQSFRDQFQIIPKDHFEPRWILTGYDG